MVWSHRADLGGVGIARARHGPCNMVALGLQDLWAAGVGPNWALRLLGQRTQGCAANQLAALGEGGDSAKRRVAGDQSSESPNYKTGNNASGTVQASSWRGPAQAGQRVSGAAVRQYRSVSLRATATSQPKGN